jgi:cellobiose phosphorylase
MFVSSFLQGVLGEQADAEHQRLTLKPNLPSEWNRLSVQRLRVGGTTMDVTFRRSENRIELQVGSKGIPVELTFMPMLPAGARFTMARIDQHRIIGVMQHPGERVSIPVLIRPDGVTHTVSVAYQVMR